MATIYVSCATIRCRHVQLIKTHNHTHTTANAKFMCMIGRYINMQLLHNIFAVILTLNLTLCYIFICAVGLTPHIYIQLDININV